MDTPKGKEAKVEKGKWKWYIYGREDYFANALLLRLKLRICVWVYFISSCWISIEHICIIFYQNMWINISHPPCWLCVRSVCSVLIHMYLEIGVSEVKLRSTCSTPKSIKHYDGCTTPGVVHRSNPHHFPTILVSSVHLNRQRNWYKAYKKLLPLNYVITCSFTACAQSFFLLYTK